MLNYINDDEWLELSLALNGALAELPEGSRFVEALDVPPFQAAARAGGAPMRSVITVDRSEGITGRQQAATVALSLAEQHTRPQPTPATRFEPAAPTITIAVTQTDDGSSVAMAVAGLPGEKCSFSSFDLRPGSHSIDVGFEVLAQLRGWAIRTTPPAGQVDAA